MYHYYLSFYGQTDSAVRECMHKVQCFQPLVRGWSLLTKPVWSGPNKPSHTVDLLFRNANECKRATAVSQLLAQTYLPYSVGDGFVAQDEKAPLDLTPDHIAYPRRFQGVHRPAGHLEAAI